MHSHKRGTKKVCLKITGFASCNEPRSSFAVHFCGIWIWRKGNYVSL